MNFKRILIYLVLFFIYLNQDVNAEGYINIVNPVRIAPYTVNLPGNIETQYKLLSQRNLPATWLLSFDVMKSQQVVSEIKKFKTNQEIGIFLEITPLLATTSGVDYNETGSWHHASSIFLSGYSQKDRVKMINTLFGEYKKQFGYYPKTVGSWWTDSFSLNYMKDEYEITGNVDCSDQQDTDGYTIRGKYWSIPFYSHKTHAARPAKDRDNSSGVVTVQWAPRDPINGYENSKYSSQDYFTFQNLNIDYYSQLIEVYLSTDQIGQVTLGLESDLSPEAYLHEYAQQLDVINNKITEKKYRAVTVSEFSNKYKETFPIGTPPVEIRSKDLLGNNIESIWYQSAAYRINYLTYPDKVIIRDLRHYGLLAEEEFFKGINRQNVLQIHTPAVIDSVANKEEGWVLPRDTKINLYEEKIKISSSEQITPPSKLFAYPGIQTKYNKSNIEIEFMNVKDSDHIYKYLSAESKHFFNQKKFPIELIKGKGWNNFQKTYFEISQDEYIALLKLKNMKSGQVLVANKECLQCEYLTKYPHPAFANNREYIARISGKKIIYDDGILDSTDRKISRTKFNQSGANYIYLIKSGSYIEKLPFSPGDTGVMKVFENSTSEIWEKRI